MPGASELEMNSFFQSKVFAKFEPVGAFIDTFEKSLLLPPADIGETESVLEQRQKQCPGWVRAENFALEAVADQFRDAADMVDVGVGEKKVVDILWGNRPGLHRSDRVMALGHTAINEHIDALCLQEMT